MMAGSAARIAAAALLFAAMLALKSPKMACLGAEGRGSRVGEAIAATQRARSTIPVHLKIATRPWESTAYAAAGGGKPTGKARPEGGDCQPTATAFRAYARLRHLARRHALVRG